MCFQTETVTTLENLQWCWAHVSFGGFNLRNKINTHSVQYSLEQKSILRQSAKQGESWGSTDAKHDSPSLKKNPAVGTR